MDAISHLRLGQAAKLQFTTFNSRVTPVVDGTLAYISADAVIESGGVLMYVIQIDPDRASLARASVSALKPGMAAEVYVTTHPRSIVNYLLAPITKTLSRAMREL